MSFAFIILFFALLIWIKAFIHDRISRFVLLSFVAYWCFALFSSTLSPLGLFPISDGTYGVLTLGVLSFVFGMSIVSTNSETKLNTYDLTQIKTIFNKTLSSRILICVYIIFTLIALKYSTKALIISALQDSASEMAAERETLIFEENYWVSQAYTYLMFPLFNFASMAIAYIIMYQLKGCLLYTSWHLVVHEHADVLLLGHAFYPIWQKSENQDPECDRSTTHHATLGPSRNDRPQCIPLLFDVCSGIILYASARKKI